VNNGGERTTTTFDTVGGTARLMFYSLLAISLMSLDYRGQYVDRIRAVASQAIEPVFWAVDLPAYGIDLLASSWQDRTETRRRIREVELELAKAQARLGRMPDLVIENAQLRAVLETARRTRQEFIAAELASIDLDPFAHRVIVRRGRADGVRSGMPVIDARGVLGQVEQVFSQLSQVILISDPDHALPIQILPGGERTIAYGSGSLDRLRLTDLPMNTVARPGDLVVTSGIGGRFAPGLPVARIESIQRQPGQAFATARAAPLAAMDRNRLVLILKPEADQTSGAGEDARQQPPDDTNGENAGEDQPESVDTPTPDTDAEIEP